MNENVIKPSILPGFMELLPSDQGKFNDIVEKILNVYEKNGCLAIDTPIIEKADVLLAKQEERQKNKSIVLKKVKMI